MKRLARPIALLTLMIMSTVLLTACSGTTLLNALVPHSGYAIKRDIAYGDQPRQQLDIYIPDGLPAKAPVIVFFYGGSWQKGSKDDYRFVGQAFAAKGYITVIADYRLYPAVRFPVFVQDGAQALGWVQRHITEYGGNAQQIFVGGHSAGAYIAVLLGTGSAYTPPLDWVKGIIGIAGPYDFLPFTDPAIKDIFSQEAAEKTQPIYWVKPGLPPMLLVTGNQDTDVFPKNTFNMTKQLRQAGNMVTEKIYPDIAHIGIILSLADGFRVIAPLLADIDTFIKTSLQTKE